jgi:uncharacterized protein with FMN-binding domain
MKKKGKSKMIGWIIVLVVLTAAGIPAGIGISKLNKEHAEARNVSLNGVDFNSLIDGEYTGSYEGGMFKWRANTVKVVVSEGKLSEIEPISGVIDQGKGSTKMLYDRVIANQSLMVDTISGATLTSKGYLKAVEIALSQAN